MEKGLRGEEEEGSNIWGLRSILTDLSIQPIADKLDLICLTESFLSQDSPDSLLALPGYWLLQFDRPESHPGGGVALYIKNSISHSSFAALAPPKRQEYLRL